MLTTERLILRPLNETDVDAVYAMRSDADVMRYIRPRQIERREAEDWIRLVSSRWEKQKIGFCAVVEKASNEFLGWCGLWRLPETNEIEVGYAIRKEFWGRGYAVEASEAFLRYGFETLALDEIVAVAQPENKNSRRVMEKLGMIYDGNGYYYQLDLAHYAITKNDYFRNRKTAAPARYA